MNHVSYSLLVSFFSEASDHGLLHMNLISSDAFYGLSVGTL
jgi:hypothetical protein